MLRLKSSSDNRFGRKCSGDKYKSIKGSWLNVNKSVWRKIVEFFFAHLELIRRGRASTLWEISIQKGARQ